MSMEKCITVKFLTMYVHVFGKMRFQFPSLQFATATAIVIPAHAERKNVWSYHMTYLKAAMFCFDPKHPVDRYFNNDMIYQIIFMQ